MWNTNFQRISLLTLRNVQYSGNEWLVVNHMYRMSGGPSMKYNILGHSQHTYLPILILSDSRENFRLNHLNFVNLPILSQKVDIFYGYPLIMILYFSMHVKLWTHREFWLRNNVGKTCLWKQYMLLYECRLNYGNKNFWNCTLTFWAST